ncbi:excalibur calcium-binding domain-containing protein [Cardiobacteriaceae bacterium TAE3-ERU3]|nr:excalibur calcium-binding domain-containing protein [Cardiobacteriaceae bacterium TAE3-ERU3]
MRSCDEAKYFIRHCPNTKMDGDGDGIPCERQLCGH